MWNHKKKTVVFRAVVQACGLTHFFSQIMRKDTDLTQETFGYKIFFKKQKDPGA